MSYRITEPMTPDTMNDLIDELNAEAGNAKMHRRWAVGQNDWTLTGNTPNRLITEHGTGHPGSPICTYVENTDYCPYR